MVRSSLRITRRPCKLGLDICLSSLSVAVPRTLEEIKGLETNDVTQHWWVPVAEPFE